MEAWIAAPLCLFLTAIALYCHRNWLAILPEDPPAGQGRRRHSVSMPMAGFVPALLALAAMAVSGVDPLLLGGIALCTLTGYLDDHGKARGHEMHWRRKAILLLGSTGLVAAHLTARHDLCATDVLLSCVWLFALTNAVNFMDNTDGVAASLGGFGVLLACQAEGPMAWPGYAFLGFLLANWPRPLLFLGDSGALCLGLCLGCASLDVSLQAGAAPLSTVALAPAAVFVLDFVQVVLARLLLGLPPWHGDRRHLTHISQNLGLHRVLVAPVFVLLGWWAYTRLA